MDIIEELRKAFDEYIASNGVRVDTIEYVEACNKGTLSNLKRAYISDLIVSKLGADNVNKAITDATTAKINQIQKVIELRTSRKILLEIAKKSKNTELQQILDSEIELGKPKEYYDEINSDIQGAIDELTPEEKREFDNAKATQKDAFPDLQKRVKDLTEAQKGQRAKMLEAKRQIIIAVADKTGKADIRKKLSNSVETGKDETYYANIDKELSEALKEMPETCKQQCDRVNALEHTPLAYLIDQTDEMVEGLKSIIDERTNEELSSEFAKYVPVPERPVEEVSEPVFKEKFPEFEALAKTQEEKDALEYVKQTFRKNEKAFDNFITNEQSNVMRIMKLADNDYTNKFLDKNEKFKDLYTTSKSSINEINPEKRKEFDEYSEMSYKFTDQTKNAMKKIMHTLDDMGYITKDNVTVAEEGDPKMYGFVGMQKKHDAIITALKNNEVSKLPKLVKEYQDTKRVYDEMMQLCRDNFSHKKYLYSSNVDVARNTTMPLEYRKDSHNASMISSLFIALKYCKITGTPIDSFVDNPNKYFRKTYTEMYEKSDVDKLMQKTSLGDALYYMKEGDPIDTVVNYSNYVGMAVRAEECMKAYDKDDENVLHNTYLCNTNKKLYSDNYNTYTASRNFLAGNQDGTILNMAIYGKTKSVFELTYSERWKYDVINNKKYGMLDTESYIKNNELDYETIQKNVKEMYVGCAKDYLLKGKKMNEDLVKSLKNVTAKIAELKPNEKDKPEFKKLKEITDTFVSIPNGKQAVEIFKDENGKLSPEGKTVAIFAYKNELAKYNRKGLITRMVSYLPFVNNSATKMRNAYKDSLVALKESGITDKEINDFKIKELPSGRVPFENEKIDVSKIEVRSEKEAPVFSEVIAKDVADNLDIKVDDPLNTAFYLEPEEEKEFKTENKLQ